MTLKINFIIDKMNTSQEFTFLCICIYNYDIKIINVRKIRLLLCF